MKRIDVPNISPESSFETCVNGINDAGLKSRLLSSQAEFEQWAEHYKSQAHYAQLFSIAPLQHGKYKDPFVLTNVYKSELVKLYDYYMVKKPSARKIYDEIKISAKDKCPYCGGIGRPETVDHYLPKSKFPQFSVLPINLLPCCRDCNSGSKKAAVATTKNTQSIHPYMDAAHFFDQQWIKARVIQGTPCSLQYFVDPPVHWDQIDKDRVGQHFEDFELARRYRLQASEELTTVIDKRKKIMRRWKPNIFREDLESVGDGDKLFANHWKKVMYQSLSEDIWFCQNPF